MRHLLLLTLILATACTTTTTPVEPAMTTTIEPTAAPPPMTAAAQPAAPTAEEATQFVNEAEAQLAALNVDQQRAAWVQSTFITYDTQIIAARENERLINAGVELAKKAAR